MRFPDLDEIVALADTEYEREFLRAEFTPGLDYYVERVDRLLFHGNRVLDAGCGAGQWSIALARRFAWVDALDLKHPRLRVLRAVADRLGVSNIRTCRGALEQLPYGDEAFDAVFCYGVIMFTRVEQVLAEFHRVLRPGGRVYLCLNADGWSRHLAEGAAAPLRPADGRAGLTTPLRQAKERPGATGPNAGLATLYTTYWHRAIHKGLHDALVEGAKEYPEGLLPWEGRLLFKIQRRVVRWFRRGMAVLGGKEWKRSLARDVLCRSSEGRELFRRVRGFCGEEFVPLLLDDVAGFLETGATVPRFGPTRAIRPEEMEQLATGAGFVDFQWSVEAGLACDWTRPVAPKYPGYHGDDLSVWECLLAKPDRGFAPVSVQRHVEAARQAALTPVYLETSPDPVLSNASVSTYPLPMVLLARRQAEMLGGASYMKRLARAIVGEERDEEQVVRRTIRFVQRAVFRDPVAQPLCEDGSLPDGLTTLACARGRCGHTAQILVDLLRHCGLDARLRQFPRHVVAEVQCGDRWVLADADAFKGGVIPEGASGRLLSMEELQDDPYVLDRFPPTGWMMRPGSRPTRGLFGRPVRGYVDALEPDQRGFVSGYYVPRACGYPPSLPEIRQFEAGGGRFVLSWTAARVREGRVLGYRVRVGTRSRGWTYDDVFLAEAPLPETACDVLQTETAELCIEGRLGGGESAGVYDRATASGLPAAEEGIPGEGGPSRLSDRRRVGLFASVTAVSDRVELEPLTFFWPSEEAHCVAA